MNGPYKQIHNVRRSKGSVKRSVILVLAMLGSGASLPVLAADDPTFFKIPSQDLASALNQFAVAANWQIVFSPELVRDRRAPAISGSFTRAAAIAKLLSGSGLRYRLIGEKTYAVESTEAAQPGATGATQPKTGALNTAIFAGDESGTFRLSDAGDADGANKQIQKDGKKESSVEEMVVEGQRDKPAAFSTANLDLTRTEDDALPFITFTARDIELSGAVSINEFLQARLPQNFSDVVVDETSISGSGESRSANISMRGWNNNETVFLLNGRRMALQYRGTAQSGQTSAPDLQGIPLGAIERIEILPSAGSAIYGASAAAGVINIITRRDFKGGQLNISYASPADAHAPSRGVDANYSMPSFWGTNIRLSGSYNESEPLRVGDRSDVSIERWRSALLAREPARLLSRTAAPPYGALPNIRTIATTDTANLFGNGTSNFATVVAGSNGSGGLAAFRPGVYDLELPEKGGGRSQYGKDGYLGGITSNIALGLGFDKKLSDGWDWSVDYRYSQNDGEADSSGSITFSSAVTSGSSRVPALAPINPFGQDVRVALTDPRLARPELNGYAKNVTWEASSTLRGAMGEWRGFLDFNFSRNNSASLYKNFVEPVGGWANAFMTGAYNPFVDVQAVAPAAASFYDNYIMQRQYYASSNSQSLSSIKASGPLVRLPWGALQMTVGAEWSRFTRHDSISGSYYSDAATGEPRVPFGRTAANSSNYDSDPYRTFEFSSQGVYSEMVMPIALNKPLMEKVELFASGRMDRRLTDAFDAYSPRENRQPFKVSSQESVYAFGTRYELRKGLTLRASQSVGFVPPYVASIGASYSYKPGEQPYTATFNDPRRPNGTAPSVVVLEYHQLIWGGNPDLLPETTISKNFGIILAPELVPGLRMSVDYVESVRNDAITSFGFQDLVDSEADLPGRIIRGLPDGHPSGVGPIVGLNMTPVNLNEISSKSLDVSLDKRFSDVLGGDLIVAFAGTKNISFKVQYTNGIPPVEQIRNVSSYAFSQQIRWNGNTQVQWDGRRWSFGWSARYYDYLLTPLSNVVLQGSTQVPWKINHDAFVNYRMGKQDGGAGVRRALSGTSITFGVKNVFDREPRFWAANTDRGVAPYDSIMGRSLWLQMRKDFN